MSQTLSPKRARRGACSPVAQSTGIARRSGHGTARLPDGRTTVSILNGARDLMEVALPFTAPVNGCKESFEEFASKAISARVALLQAEHKFPLPPGLELSFPFTK